MMCLAHHEAYDKSLKKIATFSDAGSALTYSRATQIAERLYKVSTNNKDKYVVPRALMQRT